jgi:hypothetical protein
VASLASAARRGLPEPVAFVAWKGPDHGASGLADPGSSRLASDVESFEAFLPREPHAAALALVAPLARAPLATATPTPTPFGWIQYPTPAPGDTPIPTVTPLPASYQGCHRWRYALRWEQPSRLAILKNVLGNSVTTYTDFKAPGSGNQNDWPDPIFHSMVAGAWNYASPSQPTVGTYAHDCDAPSAPACQGVKPFPDRDNEGEHPGIWYSKGTWDWPDPNSQDLPAHSYNSFYPPLYHPGADTTGSLKYEDAATPPVVFVAAPYGTAGTYDGWAWTLNYGYAAAPGNDIVYGPDPGPPLGLAAGPPFALMDDTTDAGNSIPGVTGTPVSFPTDWQTRGGAVIGVPTVTPKPTDSSVILFGGINQPSWTKNLFRDVVGRSKDLVNWGLMTYTGLPAGSGGPVYNTLKTITTIDTGAGDVSVIEGHMRHRFLGGLAAVSGTPTKGAISEADAAMGATWGADPRKACNRAYGVILCTDGESNITNTGTPADAFWGSTATPCNPDSAGTAFINFPPGAAEAMYLNAHQVVGGAIVRARTFAIGISSDVSRCELNRTAYRGRTDAGAKKKDAGFVLYDTTDPPVVRGDIRLPHINPAPETAGTSIPTDESGPGLPDGGINRFDPDQATPVSPGKDYAFFASDAKALYIAFQTILNGSATGDYTTSAPVSGAAIGLGSTVVLTSATYPLWQGHIKALDTSPLSLTPPQPIVTKWDAGAVLTSPDLSKPWQPTPATRSLYTWDPASGNLIAITAANAGLINGLCGAACATTPITASVVDFIRGNDGTLTNTTRPWLLGPSINVTPAIVGPAQPYFQTGNVVNHKPFEGSLFYKDRRTLTWLGADDGLLHAFDMDDGAEVIGLLPPNLIANQITLYNNFLDPDAGTDTGQNAGHLFEEHTWGVASSLRFADVWFGAPTNSYKTVGFLTEGPGGDVVAAIDITHPYPGRASSPAVPADKNFNSAKPVEILWTKNSSNYAGLFSSWSVPAVAADTFTTSKMTFGAGINPNSLYNAQKNASVFVVDPVDGTLVSSPPVAILPLASPDPLVGLQTFTDSIFFQTNAVGFQNDNIANLSLQGDTNGRLDAVWGGWASPNSKALIDLNAAAGGPQPLYYSPAANGIGTLGTQVYALASGSFYETSPAVSGWNVNRDTSVENPPAGSGYPDTLPAFVPTLFVATNPYKIADVGFGAVPIGKAPLDGHILKEVIAGIPLSPTCFGPGPDPAPGYDKTYSDGLGPTPCHPEASFVAHTSLGIHTQVTSSPLLVGNASSPTQTVFFTVYDPDYGCTGFSYVLKVEFAISAPGVAPLGSKPTWGPAGSPPGFTASQATTVFAAGAGAASGFVVTDTGAFVGQSGLGKGVSTLVKVEIPTPQLPGAPNFVPVWWKEQK